MKMLRVFGVTVIRREIHAAAEPPDRILGRRMRDEEAHVHVHGRGVGIARVQNERYPGRIPRTACEFRTRRGCRGRQRFPGDVREIDAAALEDLALLEERRLDRREAIAEREVARDPLEAEEGGAVGRKKVARAARGLVSGHRTEV